MWKLFLTLCVSIIIVASCNSDKYPFRPLQEQTLPISYEIGQKWLYKRLFVNIGISKILDCSDTVLGYACFTVVDTNTINDSQVFIIEGVDYDIQKDSIYSFRRKWAVFISDSIMKVLEYSSSENGFSQGPFKRRNIIDSFESPIDIRRALYKNARIKYNDGLEYESYPLKFPLIIDRKWIYRYGHDVADDIYRKYCGQEVVSVPAGNINTYKIEWLFSEYYQTKEDSINTCGYDWYNAKGLVKRYFQFGETIVTDSFGETIGKISNSFDILEFLGEFSFNPDTLRF
jgi:hypothetical protein